MASIIDTIIPLGAFEIIRDRIALILAEELPNQAILQGDSNLNAKVFTERFTPFANVDTPCVNVSLSSGDYTQFTRLSQKGTYEFLIDVYEKAKTEGTVRGDFLASQKLQKLANVCRGILSHHRYNTLAFAKPFIEHTEVKEIKIAAPQKDKESANLTWARMIFEVRAPDIIDGIIPPDIDTFTSQVLLGLTINSRDSVNRRPFSTH